MSISLWQSIISSRFESSERKFGMSINIDNSVLTIDIDPLSWEPWNIDNIQGVYSISIQWNIFNCIEVK